MVFKKASCACLFHLFVDFFFVILSVFPKSKYLLFRAAEMAWCYLYEMPYLRGRQAINRLELFTDIYGLSDAICYSRAITAEGYVQDVQGVTWCCASSASARLAEKSAMVWCQNVNKGLCVSFPLKYFVNHHWSMWQALISECFVHAESTKSQSEFQSHTLHHASLLFHHLSKCKYCSISF